MSENNTPAIPPQPLDAWFLKLLACPACEQRHPVHLNSEGNALHCACGKYAFPIRDGIPIMLTEEATVLNPEAMPENYHPDAE